MIKKIVSFMIILIFTFTILLTSSASNKTTASQESTKQNNTDIQSKLIECMDYYSKKNQFSGTVLVAKDDDVLLYKGYGMADYENNIANTTQTVFEIGSITKQFTATAILMLQESKLLSVQDLLSKYIPDYPNGDRIKIYNLLNHTSGIPEYLNFIDSMESGRHTYTTEELIELFKNKSLNFDTGTSFEYSNSNYILLGYIIEKSSKIKYEDYIEKNILKPLKLNKTGFLSNQPTIKDKAIGYSAISAHLSESTKIFETENSLPYSAGEIYSTAKDLYNWENALCTGKLISEESLNEMFTPYLSNYGYGWCINKNGEGGGNIIYHQGNITGYTSFIAINIDKKYVLIVLSNKDNDSNAINTIPMRLYQILDK